MRLHLSTCLVLLFTLIARSANAQPVAQSKDESPQSGADPNPNAPQAPIKKTIALTLPQKLDARKLKAGETLTLEPASLYPGVSFGTPIVLRVVDVSASGKDGRESRISVQFVLPNSGSGSATTPLHLGIQAIASPAAIQWSSPLVIVDHFPCDPKVARNGCDHPHDDPEANLDKPVLSVCKSQRGKNTPQSQRLCADPGEAHGTYGYSELSLSTAAVASSGVSSIVSSKKNIELEQDTYLILSGPDVETVLLHHP